MLPLNDLKRLAPEVRSEVAVAVQRVLNRGWYVHGPELEAFENEFASYTGARFCIGVGNGTDALELALRATGVRPGSRVATIASAGMYATTAILACGAIPVWIDVQPGTSHMNLDQLSSARPDLQAVVATHLYGQMEPMPEVLDAAGSVPVIEDCAQAHGASLQGRQAGTWGIAGCFSFYPTKNLGAFGDGGAVITSDAEIAGTIRALRQYGWTAKYASSVQGGRNSRLDEMQAAVLRAKLPYLDRWNQRRREIAEAYGLLERSSSLSDVVHLYVIRTPRREAIRAALHATGIATEVHYPIPDYRQASVVEVLGESPALRQTELSCQQVLTLPCFPEMTDEEVFETRRIVLESL